MNTDDKKINIDDITFDDMIDDGIEDTIENEEESTSTENVKITEDEPAEEVLAEIDLDADLESKQEEEEDEDETIEKPVLKKKSKEQVSKDDEEVKAEEDDSIVGQVLSKLGYEVDETYDDTTEGLVALAKDVGTQMADDTLDELFEKFPLVKKHLDYAMSGGDSQNFMTMYDPRSDYSKINLREKDLQTQRYVLAQYFKTKGHDDEFVSEMLEDYEDSGKLYKKANAAKSALEKYQQEERYQALEGQKQSQVKQKKEQKEFWDGVYETIDTSTEFKGISVPEREKNKFFNYLSKPVTKEGYTQRDLDHSDSQMDTKLAIDYLMFKGFNLDKIIDKKARTKSTRTLKDKIKANKESVKSAKTARKTTTTVDVDSLDLDLF
tara:strand:+ start:1914 stop:3053 length:1140 start_codon:yes stop_codon:yes gene_type:complete